MDIKKVIEDHRLWVQGGAGGIRADLRGADLRDADLRGADLRDADLRGAWLTGAWLTGANLTGADLRGAWLTGAWLTGANLTGADLPDADLTGADLTGADLRRANLTGANLRRANLTGANLTGADLRRANLHGADLTGAYLPHFQICPQEGAFIAYKALAGKRVAKLLIPDTAARTSSLVGRKCRAEFVEVLEIKDAEGNDVTSAPCTYDDLVYSVGQTVYPDSYDPDIRVECTHGIHFFISRKEAQEYCP